MKPFFFFTPCTSEDGCRMDQLKHGNNKNNTDNVFSTVNNSWNTDNNIIECLLDFVLFSF